LLKKTDKDALTILKDASKNPKYKSNTDQGKAINFYGTILDTVASDKQDISPLLPSFAKIYKVNNTTDLQQLLSEMEPISRMGFFGVGVDNKNSRRI
jgi:endothelin-converting enzyme/putative endopeptidase